jgi:predicted transcriptional regulator
MKRTENLGSLESDIMEVMWHKQSCHIRDVFEVLLKKRKIAYTTVMTVMVRLVEKGLLTRKKDSNTFIYSCKCSKKNFVKQHFGKTIQSLLSSFGAEAMTAFADEVDLLPKEKREELVSLLTKKG